MIRYKMVFAALVLLGSILASPAMAAHPAEQLVHDTTESVLARLKNDTERLRGDAKQIYPLVEDLVLPHFDFSMMSQLVLGKNWRSADEAQQGAFTEQFRTLLVRTYGKALLEYTDQTLSYLPFHAEEGAKKVTVKTEILQQGGAPSIPLHYSMYLNKAGQWKVYDFKVDGVSLVSNYRSSFNAEIRSGGMPSLLSKLQRMNEGGETGE